MIKHISYSWIHLLACPYAAFLRYDAAVKGPTTPWLALGNAVHYALELGHGATASTTNTGQKIGDGEFNISLAAQLFRTEFARIIEDEHVLIGWPQIKKMETEGLEMIGGYHAAIEDLRISPKPLALEKEFRLPFEGTEVVGRIDKVEYDDGYIITDFKTGKTEPTGWFLSHNLQLTTYAWACLELYGELPKKVIWHHLRNGKLIESTRTMDDIADLHKMLHNAISMNTQGMRHRIYHEQVCGQCDYRGSMCDDRELESLAVAAIESGTKLEPQIYIKDRQW